MLLPSHDAVDSAGDDPRCKKLMQKSSCHTQHVSTALEPHKWLQILEVSKERNALRRT